MPANTPFNIIHPITRKELTKTIIYPKSGEAGGFPNGLNGLHTGIHIFNNTKKNMMFYAPIPCQKVFYQNNDLVLKLHLTYPSDTTPQTWCVLSGIQLGSKQSEYNTGDLIGQFESNLHWEIFSSDDNNSEYQNELNFLNQPLNWKWPCENTLKGENEFSGFSATHKSRFENHLKSHPNKDNELEKIQTQFESHNWWKLTKLPAPNKLIHYHPWQFLLQFCALGKKLPQWPSKQYFSHIDLLKFQKLISVVLHICKFYKATISPNLCAYLANVFLFRSLTFDWKNQEDYYLLLSENEKKNYKLTTWANINELCKKDSLIIKVILNAYLNYKADQILTNDNNLDLSYFSIFSHKDSSIANSPINLEKLAKTNIKKDNKEEFKKTTFGNLALYFVKNPIFASIYLPSINWIRFPKEVFNTIPFGVVIEIQSTKNMPPIENKIQWTLKYNDTIISQEVNSDLEFKHTIPKEAVYQYIIIECAIHYNNQTLYNYLMIPIHTFRIAYIQYNPNTLVIPTHNVFDSYPLSIDHTEQIPYGLYEQKTTNHFYCQSNQCNIHLVINKSKSTNSTDYYIQINPAIQKKLAEKFLQSIHSVDSIDNYINVLKPVHTLYTSVISEKAFIITKLFALGYWISNDLYQQAIQVFQFEWNLPVTGLMDTTTCTQIYLAKYRPGLPVAFNDSNGKEITDHFYQLPSNSQNHYQRYGSTKAKSTTNQSFMNSITHNDIWGKKALINALTALCKDWYILTEDCLEIGDLSLWCGGFMDGHKSHTNGISVDCRSKKVGAPSYQGTNNLEYDAESTIQFCLLAQKHGFKRIYTTCPIVLARIGSEKTIPIVKYIEGHHHHLHMDYVAG